MNADSVHSLSATSLPRAQRANLPQGDFRNAKNLLTEKELARAWSAVVLSPRLGGGTTLRELLTIHWYRGRTRSASRIYCSLWLHGGHTADGRSGHGQAGGGGYCKFSAAFAGACRSAGIILDQDIHGRGMSSVRGAIEAIAKACGYGGDILLVEHG